MFIMKGENVLTPTKDTAGIKSTREAKSGEMDFYTINSVDALAGSVVLPIETKDQSLAKADKYSVIYGEVLY